MRSSARSAAALAIVASAVALQHAQTPQSGTQFRGGVEYVQVDARVVDANGEPIRGLTKQDFKVFEDGVAQDVRTFSVVDLPPPAISDASVVPALRPDVATNTRAASRGRTYLIVFDALQVAPVRTLLVRKLLREFIERNIGADDLVGVVSLGYDRAFENFTHDKARVLATVGALIGQAQPSTAVSEVNDLAARAARISPTHDADVVQSPPLGGGVTDDARQSLRRLAQIVQQMSTAGEGSNAIVLVSEGLSFDPTTATQSLTYLEASSLIPDIQRVATAVRLGNVPIYPVYPRGLTDGAEDAIDAASGADGIGMTMLAEARRQQDNLRVIADDSGGVPIVGTNDLAGGLNRMVRLSSHYYVLGYNSSNTKADGRFHRITVTVTRPDARVLSRKGYNAPRAGDAKSASILPGPPGSSAELRDALNAALPVPSLPLSMSVAAFRAANGQSVSAAVVLESSGIEVAEVDAKPGALLEMTAVALEGRGVIRNGEHGRIRLAAASDAIDRVRQSGLRWIARLENLSPGRYQFRGAMSNGSSGQGSVWYDLEIPDFRKTALAMSDVVLSSKSATADRVTVRSDKALATAVPFPPTSTREFSAADSIAVYAEVYDNDGRHAREIETSVAIIDDRGGEKARTVEMHSALNGVVRIGTRVALAPLQPGAYTLAVEARQTASRSISAGRAIPFRIR
ncbi:MAG TPA: VWA domain-containing protein [Vicinamibacterales bacterium]|nr:VWA domain-containing protein [Vicinamibacterales bacterium]